jgi:hypothetical protein
VLSGVLQCTDKKKRMAKQGDLQIPLRLGSCWLGVRRAISQGGAMERQNATRKTRTHKPATSKQQNTHDSRAGDAEEML